MMIFLVSMNSNLFYMEHSHLSKVLCYQVMSHAVKILIMWASIARMCLDDCVTSAIRLVANDTDC